VGAHEATSWVDYVAKKRKKPKKRKRTMEPNKVLDVAEDSLGQRVAQKVSDVGETAGRKVDAAVGYVDKAKREVTQSLERIKGEGFDGLKQRALDYTRQQPLKALAMAAGAGILLAWVTNRGNRMSKGQTTG
jgi:ElaB/YqjD/DUF883 family membrane-anchored ribosome-binding protein